MGDLHHRTGRAVATIAAMAFIGFFVWIIVIADKADGVPWWSFIDKVPFGDKVGHLGLVSTLSFLCNFAFTRKTSTRPRFITLTTWVLFFLLSLEELSQGFIPHRHLDLFDWLADLAGLGVGQFCATKFRRFLKSPGEDTSGHRVPGLPRHNQSDSSSQARFKAGPKALSSASVQ